jgi:subfamily B ATP-binding cassette protein MsbA
MLDYLKKVLELVKPYRFRFALGLLCGFLSGALAFTLPLSLTLALSAVFPEKKITSSLVTSTDIKDARGLAAKLSQKTDAVSVFLYEQMDAAARTALASNQGAGFQTTAVGAALERTLNRVILGQTIYETSRFREVKLRPETQQLLAQNPQGEELARLNRMLLEDTYPKLLLVQKSRSNQGLQFLPPMLKKIVDGIGEWLNPSEHPAPGRIVFAIALIPGAMLIRGLLGYLNIYMLSWVGIRAANDLKVRLFAHLMHLPLGFFSRTSTGDLMVRIEGAIAVSNTINGAFATIIKEPITIIVLIFSLVALQPLLSLATLVVFPVCLIPVIIYGRKLRKSHHGIHEKFAGSHNVLHESFTGIRVIKGYNLESLVVEQFRRATNAVTGFFMRSVRASELPGPLIEFIGAIGVALIFVYFAFAVPGHSQGNLVAFFAAVFNLYAPLKNLSRLQSQLTLARAGVDPIYDVLAIQTSLPEPAQPKPLKAGGAAIRFENVSFSYGEKTVLHDINLTIQPGQLVALVGRTGSGKTSIANLLLRFYDPQTGAILIGDTDIRAVASRDLRANIAIVTQDTILFNDTIRNNIALGRPGATNAEIEEAAIHAYAHGFITQDKHLGYETQVGEKGINVSGGQRQRIAIARAILRNAPILILDEATNALDPESERIVQAALEKLMEGRTTICIAHRLSTIQRADLIVVLDNGRIVETGTHAELLRTGGIYSKLHELAFEEVPT